ncbi:hypothetical protein CO610_02180 [Lysobacteraceae bacterium NML95-0200]|nr:hypothetical protein CO610_02180 [Xanthomonadaceae bacterium NML95-0200]
MRISPEISSRIQSQSAKLYPKELQHQGQFHNHLLVDGESIMEWLQRFIVQTIFRYTDEQYEIFISAPQATQDLVQRGIAILISCMAFQYGVYQFSINLLLKPWHSAFAFSAACAFIMFLLEVGNTREIIRERQMTRRARYFRITIIAIMSMCAFLAVMGPLKDDIDAMLLERVNATRASLENDARYKDRLIQARQGLQRALNDWQQREAEVLRLSNEIATLKAEHQKSLSNAEVEAEGYEMDGIKAVDGKGPKYGGHIQKAKQHQADFEAKESQLAHYASLISRDELDKAKEEVASIDREIKAEAVKMHSGAVERFGVLVILMFATSFAMTATSCFIVLFYMLLALLPEGLAWRSQSAPGDNLFSLVQQIDDLESLRRQERARSIRALMREESYRRFFEKKEGAIPEKADSSENGGRQP